METISPPASSVGVGIAALFGKKSVAAAFGTRTAPSSRKDAFVASFVPTNFDIMATESLMTTVCLLGKLLL